MDTVIQSIIKSLVDIYVPHTSAGTPMITEWQANKIKPKGLIIISNLINNYKKLVECVMLDILVFIYDPTEPLSMFKSKLNKLLSTVELKSLEYVGWVFHGLNTNTFRIVSDYTIQLDDRHNVAQYQHLIDIINSVTQYSKVNRFDLISCCLFNNPTYKHFKNILMTGTDVTYGSSSNLTGSVSGADWILESNNFNLLGTYFKLETNDILRGFPIVLKQ